MNDLIKALEDNVTFKDEETIFLTNSLNLTCKFHLEVECSGNEPEAFTRRYFILEDEDNEKTTLFRTPKDIIPRLDVEHMDGDRIWVRINKVLSAEEEETLSERDKYEVIFLDLATTRKLIRATEQLSRTAYHMYNATEAVLKAINNRINL